MASEHEARREAIRNAQGENYAQVMATVYLGDQLGRVVDALTSAEPKPYVGEMEIVARQVLQEISNAKSPGDILDLIRDARERGVVR